uniref:Uncharacterized protein n=1 Tax=Heterorhabditis bacteriophora TaxID=37862 RepID=A0A1I7WQF5_HETBA
MNDRLFKWFHDELMQFGVLNHFTLPGVKFVTNLEQGTITLESLPPPCLPSDKLKEVLVDAFWTFYRSTWLPPNGIFHEYLDHSQNFNSRSTSTMKGAHRRIRATFINESCFILAIIFHHYYAYC